MSNVEELDHTDLGCMALRKKEGSIGLCPLPDPDPSLFQMMSPREPVEALSRSVKSCGLPCLADRVEFRCTGLRFVWLDRFESGPGLPCR